MFLSTLQRRNPAFLRAAMALHADGLGSRQQLCA